MAETLPSAHTPSHEAERLRLFVQSVRDYAIYMIDPNGFVTSWNAGAQRLKGYVATEIIGHHFSRFFTPEDIAADLPARILASARERRSVRNEGWRVRKDGGRFWALAVIEAVHDEAGKLIGFAKITRDMTEPRAAEQALRDSERRFRLLVEGVVDYAIFMLDAGGLVTNWNEGARRIKGYEAEEIVGQHFSRFYTPEDRANGLPARALEAAKQYGRYESEGWRLRKDGGRFWALAVIDAVHDEDGNLVGFAKITRDITERQKAQEALRASERQFRLLMTGVTDYALYMLDLNGIVTSWNLGAERIKGYKAEEIIGQHFSRFYTEDERAAGMPARALYKAMEAGRFEAEGWRVRKDGTLFWANVVIDAIRDEAGQLVGFAKITRDITDRRETQRQLQQAQAQLAQAQKMEALGQLTGGVAHDFNNLLMIIGTQLRALKKPQDDDPRAARAVEAIDLAVKRGAALTRQLLTFSRRQSLKPEVIHLGEHMRMIRDMLVSSLDGRAKLLIDIAADAWPIEADANEFELALVNLVVNARDAAPRDGTITISAENVRVPAGGPPEAIEGEFVALSVADTGGGIPPDILSKVFDPFFTTKEIGKGTGLGLSQVHGFAHQSRGTVTIVSEVDKGTRVTLYLPRAKAHGRESTADRAPQGTGATGGEALLVEDNPEVAEVSRALLEELGYRVATAGNAEAALRLMDERRFVLVLSDIVMAGSMNGLDFARAVRERHPGVPVLLATGYAESAHRAASEFTVLRKPYMLQDLGEAIAKVRAVLPPARTNLVDFPQKRGRRDDG
jgi:PAS domain S-box-containing protein